MGVEGAAWATVISQTVGGVGLCCYTYLYFPELRLERKDCVLSFRSLNRLASYSFLTCVQQSVMNFGILMIQGLVNSFGTAVMAAFASVPKFADGGIFTGNSFIGDNMIARVNSGEMILNNRQQRNLFNLLDGNASKNPISNGSVEFKIQGKELVGVLNSYSSKTNKYR